MKHSMLVLAVFLTMSTAASAAENERQIGSWHFSSGKITLGLEGGPPPVFGSIILLNGIQENVQELMAELERKGMEGFVPLDPNCRLPHRCDLSSDDLQSLEQTSLNVSCSQRRYELNVMYLTKNAGTKVATDEDFQLSVDNFWSWHGLAHITDLDLTAELNPTAVMLLAKTRVAFKIIVGDTTMRFIASDTKSAIEALAASC